MAYRPRVGAKFKGVIQVQDGLFNTEESWSYLYIKGNQDLLFKS